MCFFGTGWVWDCWDSIVMGIGMLNSVMLYIFATCLSFLCHSDGICYLFIVCGLHRFADGRNRETQVRGSMGFNISSQPIYLTVAFEKKTKRTETRHRPEKEGQERGAIEPERETYQLSIYQLIYPISSSSLPERQSTKFHLLPPPLLDKNEIKYKSHPFILFISS